VLFRSLSYFDTASITAVPEPSSLVLVLVASGVWFVARCSRRPGFHRTKSSPTPYRVFGNHVSRKRTNLLQHPSRGGLGKPISRLKILPYPHFKVPKWNLKDLCCRAVRFKTASKTSHHSRKTAGCRDHLASLFPCGGLNVSHLSR